MIITSKFGLRLLLLVFPGLDIRSQSGDLGASKLFVQDLCPLLGFNTLYTLTIAYFWQMFLFLFIFVSMFAWKMRGCLFKLYFHLIMKITQCLLFFNFWKIDKFTFSQLWKFKFVSTEVLANSYIFCIFLSPRSFFQTSPIHILKKVALKKKGKDS